MSVSVLENQQNQSRARIGWRALNSLFAKARSCERSAKLDFDVPFVAGLLKSDIYSFAQPYKTYHPSSLTSLIFTMMVLLGCLLPMQAQAAWRAANVNGVVSEDIQDIVWTGSQYVEVGNGGVILTSTDHVTWTRQTSSTGYSLASVAWSGTQFVAVGESGAILTSPSGINWTAQASGTTDFLSSVVWSGSQFVVVGGSYGATSIVLSSPDGVNWTSQMSGIATALRSVVWSGTQFVAVGDSGTIITSTDGVNWITQTSGSNGQLYSVAWSGTQFVVVGSQGSVHSGILTSPDGVIWTQQSSGVTGRFASDFATFNAVVWNGIKFYAVGVQGVIISSTDGVNWQIIQQRVQSALTHTAVIWDNTQFVVVGLADPTGVPLLSVAWSGTQYVAVGSNGNIQRSPNGVSWVAQTSGTNPNLSSVVWNGAQFVAVGERTGAKILTSVDGATWATQNPGTTAAIGLASIAWSGTQFVAAGGPYGVAGTILTSPDAVNWTPQVSGVTTSLRSVIWSGTQFVAVGAAGTILTSPSGVNWTVQPSGTTSVLNSVVWSGTQYVVVGDNLSFGGAILTSPNGINWTLQTAFAHVARSVAWSGTEFASVGDKGQVEISADGVTWMPKLSGTNRRLNAVVWDGTNFLAVGNNSIIVRSFVMNQPPAPTSSAIHVPFATAGTSQITPNDPNPADTFTYAVSTAAINGTASVNITGLATYTPNASYAGTDSFVVTVTDAAGATGAVTVNVTVAAYVDTFNPVVTPPANLTVAASSASGATATVAPALASTFAAHDAALWQQSDGWSNGSMFQVGWRADHVSFANGNLILKLDNQPACATTSLACSNQAYASGEYKSLNTISHGRVTFRAKPAKGSGVVTGLFTYTGISGTASHDEIDIEFLGKDTTKVQFNYFVAGVGGHEFLLNLGFDAALALHDYSIEWLPNAINWYVDGVLKHTVHAGAGVTLPSRPQNIFMNLWAATGVNAWTGPFVYTAPVSAEVSQISYKPKATAAFASFLNGATATDNVAVVGDITNNAPVIFPIGTSTVTFTATDAAGNQGTATSTVTVNAYIPPDTTAPVIALNGINPATVEAGQVYTDALATVTDNVDPTNAVLAGVSTVNTAAVGSYTVTYNASDVAGNPAIPVIRTVHVVDTTNPVLTLLPANVVANATGIRTTVAIGTATATDLFAVTITNDAPVDFPIGITPVTWTATDVNGRVSSGIQQVTVNAVSTAPAVTLNNGSTVSLTAPAGETMFQVAGAAAPVSMPAGVNFPFGTLAYSVTSPLAGSVTMALAFSTSLPPVFTLYKIDNAGVVTAMPASAWTKSGANTIQLTLIDGGVFDLDGLQNGVIVDPVAIGVDTQAPVITLTGSNPVTIAQGGTFTDPGTSVTDNVDTGLVATATGAVDTTKIGTYTLTYHVKDLTGNAAIAKTRTVYITDQTKPVVSAPANITVAATAAAGIAKANTVIASFLNSATATDNVGIVGAVANNAAATLPIGTTTVTFTATDAAGNQGTATSTVTVNAYIPPDTIKPVIALNGMNPATVEAGQAYVDALATLTDNVDATNAVLAGVSTVNTSAVGSYAVTYNASDATGNQAIPVVRTVNVVDTTNPVLTLPANVVTNATGVRTAVAIGTASATDLFAVTITNNAPTDFPVGTTPVTWTATDANGRVSTGIQKVTVNGVTDMIKPVITMIGGNVIVIQGQTYTDAGATASDNVDGNITASITVNNVVNASVLGAYTITYNVSDAAGNHAIQLTRTVNVVADQPPSITLIGATPITIVQGAVYNDGGATAIDDVDGNVTANIATLNSVNTAVVASYTVTYNVSDAAGNTAIQGIRTVNVIPVGGAAKPGEAVQVPLTGSAASAEVYSAGQSISNFSAAGSAGTPPAGVFVPLGVLSYTTTVAAGVVSQTVNLTFSSALPASFVLYKVDNAGVYSIIPNGAGVDQWTQVDAMTIALTLSDGGQFDLDGMVNGMIIDPVAVGVPSASTPVGVTPPAKSPAAGGGGCSIHSLASFDPTLLVLMVFSVAWSFRRRRVWMKH